MTTSAKAYESTIAAETVLERLFTGGLARMHYLNARLLELQADIKACQPRATGSVCLELYGCGRGCTGCPHPRWVQYLWTQETTARKSHMLSINLDRKGADPALVIPRTASYSAYLRELICEAKAVQAERSQLLAAVPILRCAARRNAKMAQMH